MWCVRIPLREILRMFVTRNIGYWEKIAAEKIAAEKTAGKKRPIEKTADGKNSRRKKQPMEKTADGKNSRWKKQPKEKKKAEGDNT